MPNMQLSKNLRTLRKMHHLTQTHLSSALSISRQAYSNYENNKRTPDLDSLIKLTQIYRISLDQLVNRNIADITAEDDGNVPYLPAVNMTTRHNLYLTDDETQLIMKYRDLPADSRKIVMGFLESQVN
ncbi:helix-turn-helix transcriptional regulator [Roseburia hominis]